MQFVRPHHNLQCPVSVILIDVWVVDYIHAPAVLCFFHKLVCLGKYHGLHGASLLRYHGHADRVIVTAKSPQAADPQILLGELGLFITLAEGLQTFQLVHQRLGYVL